MKIRCSLSSKHTNINKPFLVINLTIKVDGSSSAKTPNKESNPFDETNKISLLEVHLFRWYAWIRIIVVNRCFRYTLMCNSLPPFKANLFMSRFETVLRYVEHAFAIFNTTACLVDEFLTRLHNRHWVRIKLYRSFSGVTQDSNLGPVLFTTYMNDALRLFNSRVFMYAEDLKLSNCISPVADCLAQ